jgi:hypothetical protein
MRATDLRPSQLKALAEKHIAMYTHRLDSDSPIVNTAETKQLLSIWKTILAKAEGKTIKGELDARERLEVEDAIEEGGFNELLQVALV